MKRKSITGTKEPPTIFSPFKLGPYRLKNRLVGLPVYSGYAYPDGRISPQIIAHYDRLAASGVSMVVVANAAVAPEGITSTHNLRVDRDDCLPGLARLAQTIRRQGALSGLQLNHAGRLARTKQPLLPCAADKTNLAFNIAALKNFMNFFPFERRFDLTRSFLRRIGTWRRAMTPEEREKVVVDFTDAAERAFKAGFDMVEIHGANGYLICQFLSKSTNKSASGFGGEFVNRTSFPLAVVREIRNRLPADYPLGFRLIVREWVPDGIDLPEAIAFGRLLEKEGVAYLSAAAGTYNSFFSGTARKKMASPAYLRDDVSRLTRAVNVPTIISGRIIVPSLANELIRGGVCDLIGLGRPLRADIKWVAKASRAERDIKTCQDCSWCLKRVILDRGFSCRRWPRIDQFKADFDHELLTRNYRSLLVITDNRDLDLARAFLPLHLPDGTRGSISADPTIFISQSMERTGPAGTEEGNLIKRTRAELNRTGSESRHIRYEIGAAGEGFDKTIRKTIKQKDYGIVYIGRNPVQPWRERLLYTERRRVMGLMGSNEHQDHILVPVDLSRSTLLVLMFLRQAYMGKPGFSLNFIHIREGPEKIVRQRWKTHLQVVGLETDLTLHLIASNGDVVKDLLAAIRRWNCGTIIMGKRGLSGIKRWWLGSVSAGVLKGLTDQSLILVD
jgi:2,4-dienoyl-CoA reductase (NADPH2)